MLALTRPLKIDVIVHGRFYAFDLARELINQGHDVVVYTNYPSFAAKRFGLRPDHVRSFLGHGIMTRLYGRLSPPKWTHDFESYFHRLFGTWAANQVRPNADLIYCFSGVAEEVLQLSRDTHPCARWIARGSAHIRKQHQLLFQEQTRIGAPIDKPSEWMIAREEREYALADKIVVLSSFARNSFIEEGVGPDRLVLVGPGVETQRFGALADTISARCLRIASGRPLEVLTVGSFTAQKGGFDLASIAAALAPDIRFRFVGDVSGELRVFQKSSTRCLAFHPRVPESELAKIYEAADIFIFPTIQDGAAVVLHQAAAAGLPILTTTNCAGPDLVHEGLTGWILPIRNPDAFIERLRWCDRHRPELAAMVRRGYELFEPRDWNQMAAEFIASIDGRLHSEASNQVSWEKSD